MANQYMNLSAQNVFRIDIQHEWKEDGHEFIEVWGEIECGSPALVNARDLRLKSIQNIILTADASTLLNAPRFVNVSKQVFNKGQKRNNASIYIYDIGGTAELSGSVYLNFLAMGE